MKRQWMVLGLSLGLAAALLSGCSSNDAAATGAAGSSGTGSVTIIPTLGQFSAGTEVTLQSLSGGATASGTIGADGKATLNTSGLGAAPFRVRIIGAAGRTYFDEGTNSNQPFGAGAELTALLSSIPSSGQVGMDVLTHIAASYAQAVADEAASEPRTEVIAKAGGALTPASAREALLRVVRGLAPFLTDEDQPATLISAATAANSLGSDNPALRALLSAAFARVASANSGNMLGLITALAADSADGTIDGQRCLPMPCTSIPNPGYNPATLISDLQMQFQSAANQYGNQQARDAAGDSRNAPRDSDFSEGRSRNSGADAIGAAFVDVYPVQCIKAGQQMGPVDRTLRISRNGAVQVDDTVFAGPGTPARIGIQSSFDEGAIHLITAGETRVIFGGGTVSVPFNGEQCFAERAAPSYNPSSGVYAYAGVYQARSCVELGAQSNASLPLDLQGVVDIRVSPSGDLAVGTNYVLRALSSPGVITTVSDGRSFDPNSAPGQSNGIAISIDHEQNSKAQRIDLLLTAERRLFKATLKDGQGRQFDCFP